MKKLIICPFYFQKNLLKSFRKTDPFLDIKLIDKDTIYKSFYGIFKHESITYVMQKYNVKYELAKIYVTYLPYINTNEIDNFKIKNLYEIKQDLIANGFYKKGDDTIKIIENNKVEIIGYSQYDLQLINVLNKLKVDYSFKENNKKTEGSNLDIYATAEDEIHGLMIKICDLINEGVDINDIFIYGVDNDYTSYLKRYARLYNIPINGLQGDKLMTFEFAKQFFKIYFLNHSVDETIENLDSLFGLDVDYLTFKSKILELKQDDLVFEQQYDVFTNCLNIEKSPIIYDKAVHILDDFTSISDKHIFVIGFRQTSYPIVKTDNEYLQDDLKIQLGLLTSKQTNIVNKDLMLNFLTSDNHFHYSFAYKLPSGPAYISFLAGPLKVQNHECNVSLHDYNKEASEIELLKMKDLYFKYGQIKEEKSSYEDKVNFEYRNYDNQFKKFDAIKENQELWHSYSAFKKYTTCPFSYYLEKVLQLDDDNSNFAMNFGTAVHDLLHHGLENVALEFNQLFNDSFSETKFSPKEWLFINNMIPSIEVILQVAREQLLQIKNPELRLEQRVVIELNAHSKLLGYIDKIIISDDKFVTLIDYKTGSETFEEKLINVGESLQLPSYALLMHDCPDYQKYTVGGLYINNVIHSTVGETIDNPEEPTFLKLKGKTLADVDYVTSMEPNYFSGTAKYINIKGTKSGPFEGNSFVSESRILEYMNICKQHYLKCDENIRLNNFQISPRNLGSKCSCTNCAYKDICFVKNEQIREVVLEDKKDGK